MKKFAMSTLALMLALTSASSFAETAPKDAKKTVKKDQKNAEKNAVKKKEGFVADSYGVDPAASQVNWTGKKLTGQHHGTIKISAGKLVVDHGHLKAGEIIIDMASIVDLDLADSATNAKLVGHLKSDDFFAVGTYPTAKFAITKVEAIANAAAGQPTHNVTGDLTIKNKTNSVTIPADVQIEANHVHARGTAKIDRSQFDVRYGSGKFFKGLGDKVIDDVFTLEFDILANK